MQSYTKFRLVPIIEKKCNFCHNWCESAIPVTASLLCCDSCYQNFTINGFEVQTTKGQFFNLQLNSKLKIQSSQIQGLKQNVQSLINYDVQQTYLRWSTIQSLFDENAYTEQEIQSIEGKIQQFHNSYSQQTQNLLHFMKNIKQAKRNSSLNISTDQENSKIYKSSISFTKQNKLNQANQNQFINEGKKSLSIHKNNRLEDYCKNLGATRFVNRYQYYFNTDELQKYQQASKSSKTRQFGDLLSPKISQNSSFRQSNSKKKIFPKLKFNHSICSQIFNQKQLKLGQEELKQKIISYLETKSQTSTMNRIMATYVKQAYMRTNLQSTVIELVSFKMTNIDLMCYLNLFDLDSISTIKFINVGLTDPQLLSMIDLINTKRIQRLVLTGNLLSESILSIFLNKTFTSLKQIYLGKNRINKYRVKENISELRTKFILYL